MKRTSTPLAALGLAVLIVSSASTGAVAQRLIGSKDVADNSLTSKDVKNSTITGKDVKDGSLTAADIGGGLTSGTTGPAGPPGPKGETGPAGPAGSGTTEISRLRAAFVADGRTSWTHYTSQTVPPWHRLEAGRIDVTGDFSTCENGSKVVAHLDTPAPTELFTAYKSNGPGAPDRVVFKDGGVRTGPSAHPIRVIATCSGGYLPVPSLEITVLLHLTPMDGPFTREFN